MRRQRGSTSETVARGIACEERLLRATHSRYALRVNRAENYPWSIAVACDNNLNVPAASLRQRLGREAVLTVPGHGLRFRHTARALSADEEAEVDWPHLFRG